MKIGLIKLQVKTKTQKNSNQTINLNNQIPYTKEDRCL